MEKTLRYLLIAVAAMAVMSVSAQSLAELPRADFHSTSSMVTSGSTLPQAAASGVQMSYDFTGGTRANKPTIKTWGEEGGSGTGEPGDWHEPYEDPIGEGMWALLFCAAVFSGVIAFRRKRQQRNV